MHPRNQGSPRQPLRGGRGERGDGPEAIWGGPGSGPRSGPGGPGADENTKFVSSCSSRLRGGRPDP